MLVVSASRRTDIPAFYSTWFSRRIAEGYCHTVNPFNAHQVLRVSFRPEDVIAFVFWTRNPDPLLGTLADMAEAGYRAYVHFTLNDYPRVLETHTPSRESAVRAFRSLSSLVGPDLVTWRYDPILLTDLTPADYHVEKIRALAASLEGMTSSLYVSFCHPYERTVRRLSALRAQLGSGLHEPSTAERRALLGRMAEEVAHRGMTLHTCAMPGLEGGSVHAGRCIDPDRLARLRPDLELHLPPAPTREGCGCVQSTDIGAYDTCEHGCVYCYATSSFETAEIRRKEHDPSDTALWRPQSLTGVDLDSLETRPTSPSASSSAGSAEGS